MAQHFLEFDGFAGFANPTYPLSGSVFQSRLKHSDGLNFFKTQIHVGWVMTQHLLEFNAFVRFADPTCPLNFS